MRKLISIILINLVTYFSRHGYRDETLNSFQQTTMSNIETGNNIAWIHAVGTVLLTFITIACVQMEYGLYRHHRRNYLKQEVCMYNTTECICIICIVH